MKALLVNYNFTPSWILESGLDYYLIDRSDSKDYLKDFPQERVRYDGNIGQVDYPKLMFLAENYDHLPDYFLWGKSNLFKSITEEEWEKVKNNTEFTPLLTKNHKVSSEEDGVPINDYLGDIYRERIGIIDSYHNVLPWRHFKTYTEFCKHFGFTVPDMVPFPPGGNFILTKERVYRYSRDFYREMASLLDYAQYPLEAAFCERIYYTLWN